MIRSYSNFKLGWDIMIASFACYDSFILPAVGCFEQLSHLFENKTFKIALFVVDVIYICDIIRQFRTTYYSKTTGEEIFNQRLIAKHYFRHGMLIDICASLPIFIHLLSGYISEEAV